MSTLVGDTPGTGVSGPGKGFNLSFSTPPRRPSTLPITNLSGSLSGKVPGRKGFVGGGGDRKESVGPFHVMKKLRLTFRDRSVL